MVFLDHLAVPLGRDRHGQRPGDRESEYSDQVVIGELLYIYVRRGDAR